MVVAFITGITGQDGSYLAEMLVEEKKYTAVYGLMRRSSTNQTTSRIDSIKHKLHLRYGDMTDFGSLLKILLEIKDHFGEDQWVEIYNLAAMSDVAVSFMIPDITFRTNLNGTLYLLEAIRESKLENVTMYQASTSEQFGKVVETPQTEKTPFQPQSPYAISKMAAHTLIDNYRQSYNMFLCCGILFNHESPRRGSDFVTRKVTQMVNKIACGCEKELVLGNLDAKRDWGHAFDYVRAMWLILQQEAPKDYVVASGTQYSVRQLVELCFLKVMNIHLQWQGKSVSEVGFEPKTNRILVRVDKKFLRPSEVDTLLGDSSMIRRELGWKPTKSFEDIVGEMLQSDVCTCKSQF